MQTFRKKPVEIQAIHFTRDNHEEVANLIIAAGYKVRRAVSAKDRPSVTIGLTIPTLEGDMVARYGDWIIKGVNGEFYPCKPDIFEKTYEAVSDDK